MTVRRSRLVGIAVPALAGALVLSACGSSSKSSSGGKPTLAIAYQGPLSGDNAQLGINMDNGVKLAISQANAKGDLPFTLKEVAVDDGGDPAQAPTAAQKAIGESDVVAVVGPAFSGATKAAEPLFSQANLVSVSPSATNPKLTSLGFTTFYRVVPPDDAQGKEAANFVTKKLSAKNVYSVDDKSEYGTGLSGVLEKQLKADGAQITHEGIAPTKDYSGIAAKIAGAKPDAVYYSGYYADLALFLKGLHAAGYRGPVGSGDGSKDAQLVKLAGADAEGTYLTCPCGDPNVDPKASAFTAAYKSMFNASPGTYSAEAYDSANAIISVLKGLGASGAKDRAKVAAGVKSVDYQGLTKEIKFTSSGEVQGTTIFVYQVKDGKIGVLGTTAELDK